MFEVPVHCSLANAAKRNGFNWKTLAAYDWKGELICNPSMDILPIDNKVVSPKDWNQLKGFTSAPTEAFLRKWIREKYDIDIQPIRTKNYYTYQIIIKGILINNEITEFPSYEAAINSGLNKFFKMKSINNF